MIRIVSISRDPMLLRTRELILSREGYLVVSLGTPEAAIGFMQVYEFDVLLMGHTLTAFECDELAACAKRSNPSATILLLQAGPVPHEKCHPDCVRIPFADPERLVEYVRLHTEKANSGATTS